MELSLLGLGDYVSELEEDQDDCSDDSFETDVSGNWLTVENSLPHCCMYMWCLLKCVLTTTVVLHSPFLLFYLPNDIHNTVAPPTLCQLMIFMVHVV